MSNTNNARLCELLPHAADMCLIDEVERYDAKSILCTTRSHLLASNPLRHEDRLSVLAGIEYAAQATALHAALNQPSTAPIGRPGFLAALRDVECRVERLDQYHDALTIEAVEVYAENGRSIYDFCLHAGAQPVLSGRATVVIPDNMTNPGLTPR